MNRTFSKYIIQIAGVLLLAFLLHTKLYSQISAGGKPLNISSGAIMLNSSFQEKITMPEINFTKKSNELRQDSLFKSLKFGHTFEVNLNPNNSGRTYQTNFFKIWQVEIESKNAYSINLVFNKYHLPKGARLFVYNEDQTQILGAFTARNNKESEQLAIYPLAGEKVFVQYEEPLDANFKGEISIGKVVHAYVDVLHEKNLFYPRRTSGSCNVDVQCETESALEKQKRATCRVFVVDELGTATLINNANNDGTPYLVSAYHVFDNMSNSQYAIFSFNYESPNCTGIEGSDLQTISGAKSVAGRSETDMILLQLSEMPPASFRPYYAGWDATQTSPENCYCIHHPNGDTKKISHDKGICSIGDFNTMNLKNGFWKVGNWEIGTTEFGSSGASLFNNEGRVVGTLSGGTASCESLTADVFARFDLMYDHYSLANSQLKYWLNPNSLDLEFIDGYDPYLENEQNCETFSNFDAGNQLNNHSLLTSNNNVGITEIASKFNQISSGILNGISIGINDLTINSLNPSVKLKIYETNLDDQHLIYEQAIRLEDLLKHALNYIPLENHVAIENEFYVGFELLNSSDTISFYYSKPIPDSIDNSFYLKQNSQWKSSNSFFTNDSISNLLVEVNVCDYQLANATAEHQQPINANLYPNPAKETVTIFVKSTDDFSVNVYNRIGIEVKSVKSMNASNNSLSIIDLEKGIYLVKIIQKEKTETLKLIKQ